MAPALERVVIYNFTRRARTKAQDKFEIIFVCGRELARYAVSICALHSCMMMDLCVWFIITGAVASRPGAARSARALFDNAIYLCGRLTIQFLARVDRRDLC